MIRKPKQAPTKPPLNERTERLLEIMRTRRLNSPEVGEMLGRSSQTVRMWRCESKIIPEHTLLALEQAVAALDAKRAEAAKKRSR